MQAELLSGRRRSFMTPTRATRATAATAMVGVLALSVVLLRKGRVSKARLVELLAATVGGLLSSSCCAVQLLLNSISVGCAGFAVLDRFRPLFLCLTFSSLAYKTVAYDVRLHKNPWRSLPTWLVAAALASAPLLVRRLNRGGALTLGGLSSPSSLQGRNVPRPVMLQYSVRGMKCEACAHGLKNALEALRGDLQANVLFEEGVAFLVAGVATGLNEEGEEGETAASVLQALEEGIAEVMDERGYTYQSRRRESPAPYPPQHYLEQKEL
jgi:copper chaperone CopZ